MTKYHVFGVVCRDKIDEIVAAETGALAIKAVLVRYYPKFGKNWKEDRKEWVRKNVRLNASQLSPIYFN